METEVRRTLDRLNLAWREKRFRDMEPYLDENIVMKGPGLKQLGRGRSMLVQSYVDFMGKSTITAYEESNHQVDILGLTAVATYDWSMTWEQSDKGESAAGHDMFVFERRDSRWVAWVAVLRLILF